MKSIKWFEKLSKWSFEVKSIGEFLVLFFFFHVYFQERKSTGEAETEGDKVSEVG